MTRTLRIGFALVIAAALGACSGLIPDQAIGNAFGLDGVQVTGATNGVEAIAARPAQAGSTQVSGTFATQIPSAGFDALPSFINVASISDVITIQAVVELSAPGSVAFAASYTITGFSVELFVSNADATVVDQTWDATGLELTFSGDAVYDPGSDTTSGTYLVETEVPLVTLVMRGATVTAFVDALGDGATLDVDGTIVVDLQPAFPLGAHLTFTLKSLGGTLTF